MRYRQETLAEKDCDGEFETYDEWARFGPHPPTGVQLFSTLKVGVALLSRISLAHGS